MRRCRAFVDDAVIPFIRQNWQREWDMNPDARLPASILEGADKIGIRTLGVPEEFGGIELDPATEVQTFALISEEIARGDSGLADKLVQNWKVSVLLRNLAPRHLQEKWFPRLVDDPQFLLAHCLTEPRGASDRWLPYNVPEAAMQTRAVNERRQVGDQRPQAVHLERLRRRALRRLRQHQSEGRHAAGHVELPGAARHAGPDRRALQRDDGLPLHEQRRARVRGHARAGRIICWCENDALGKAGVYFRPGKIIQASKNLGVGVRAFEVTSDYVQNYVQGGRILIKHQAVALRLADMATRIEAVRALLARAARAVDEKAPDADALCNMVKVFASEEIMKVAQHAMELHGGNGVMLDFGVEKLLRDAAIFLHMDATVDISKLKIVKSMFPETAGKYAGPEA